MKFGEYVNAAGYTRPMTSDPKKYYFKADSLMYFRKFGGREIEQMYQRIGIQDPLITVAPNPLRIPTWNVYCRDRLDGTAPSVLTDLDRFYFLNIEAPLNKHYLEPFDKKNYHAQRFDDLVEANINNNPLCREEAEYMRRFPVILETISKNNEENKGLYTAPFNKCSPVLKESIARFVCDKFMSVIPDTDRDSFINTGYFGIATGLGARFDISKIKGLIKQINPVKDGVDLTNINEIKDYIKETPFYREMMATNRYLGLVCTANALFNCSDINRSPLYTSENSPYITAFKDAIKNRDYIQPQTYRTFMKELSKLYYSLYTINDRTQYATQQDERTLISLGQMLKNPYSTL